MITDQLNVRWEIEYLKNISTINLILYSIQIPALALIATYVVVCNSLPLTSSDRELQCSLDGSLLKSLPLGPFHVSHYEVKQWSDHWQYKIKATLKTKLIGKSDEMILKVR
jgi:hypothetical protein